MSKKPPADADAALSPYLSFRQAVRPAMFANSLLLAEQVRAGELAKLASQILATTRNLLSKAGLGYVGSAGTGVSDTGSRGLGHRGSLLDAFTDAAMAWAEITGCCLAMAEDLLRRNRLDEVRRLAAVLADSGEPGMAEELLRRAADAKTDQYRKSLEAIRPDMEYAEVERALATLSEVLREIPKSQDRDIWLSSFLSALAQSAMKYTDGHSYPMQWGMLRAHAENRYGISPGAIATNVSNIAAAFRSGARRPE